MVSDSKLTFGIVGLGRIGGNLARQAKGMNVVGFTKGGIPRDLLQLGIRDACSIDRFRQELRPSRIIFLYVPAGPVVDEILGQLELVLVLSRDNRKQWARAIAMMRRGLGGHPYGRDPSVAEEKKMGRAGDFFDPVKETRSEMALRDNSFEPVKRV